MATKIRLARLGDKKSPFYRVVVADSRSPRDGKVIETIGTFDPLVNENGIKIDVELAKKWVANGAQPTDTAYAVLVKAGAIEAKKQKPKAQGTKPETKKASAKAKSN